MTPAAFRKARKALGLSQQGMAEALRLGANGSRAVRRWETGESEISGPLSLAVEYLLSAAPQPKRGEQSTPTTHGERE